MVAGRAPGVIVQLNRRQAVHCRLEDLEDLKDSVHYRQLAVEWVERRSA